MIDRGWKEDDAETEEVLLEYRIKDILKILTDWWDISKKGTKENYINCNWCGFPVSFNGRKIHSTKCVCYVTDVIYEKMDVRSFRRIMSVYFEIIKWYKEIVVMDTGKLVYYVTIEELAKKIEKKLQQEFGSIGAIGNWCYLR